jgi:hypothetical protein
LLKRCGYRTNRRGSADEIKLLAAEEAESATTEVLDGSAQLLVDGLNLFVRKCRAYRDEPCGVDIDPARSASPKLRRIG